MGRGLGARQVERLQVGALCGEGLQAIIGDLPAVRQVEPHERRSEGAQPSIGNLCTPAPRRRSVFRLCIPASVTRVQQPRSRRSRWRALSLCRPSSVTFAQL
jgi:hypothetical protein